MLHRNVQPQFRAAETDGEATLEERNKTTNAYAIFDGAKNFERNMQVRSGIIGVGRGDRT